MKKIKIFIDTTELKEETYILFSTSKCFLRKEKLKRQLVQTFSFIIEEGEELYLEFFDEKDPSAIRLIKQIGYQLIAFFPKAYYYECCFAAFRYKNAMKYKLDLKNKSSFELKYYEAADTQPIKYLGVKWSSMASFLDEYSEANDIRKEYRNYKVQVLLATGLTLLLALIWFWDDLNPNTIHLKSPPYIFACLQGALAITHASRALYVSHLQYKKIKSNDYNLNCFRQI